MTQKETDARIIIDRKLKEAGWDIENKREVDTEKATTDGRADYVLKDSRGRPIAVIEAKKFSVEPSTAKNQAENYAKELNVDFIFLSNGDVIYFWDYKFSTERLIDNFFTKSDLERLSVLRKHKRPLSTIEVPKKAMVGGRNISLRPYQIEALKTVDYEVTKGKRKILLELATGTGKTLIAAFQIKRLMQAGMVEKVLFLVDRIELARQAKSAFDDLLKDRSNYILKAGAKTLEKDITICTLQTMIGLYEEFSPGYFDLIVSDECHRSIYGAWRPALTHFDALNIGLTATPSENIEKNTYQFFDCKKPHFNYGLRRGIDEGYLAGYTIYKALTKITLDGITYEGEDYNPADLERRINIPERNKAIVKEFKKKTAGDMGKTIVYSVTKRHAAQLTHLFNQAFPEFKGKFAEVITSDIMDAEKSIKRFKKEKMPMVAVSVGMLDTGFDCREVLYLVMARPTKSATLYQQMRGRGSRLCPEIGKSEFTLFDFVGVTDYFNDDSYNPEKGQKKGGKIAIIRKEFTKPKKKGFVVAEGVEDYIIQRQHIEVGPEGEKVDIRDYQDEFSKAVSKLTKENPLLQKIKKGEKITEKELEDLQEELNKPEFYFNEENLRQAYNEPSGSLIQFIKSILGMYKFPDREERIRKAFDSYIVENNFTLEQIKFLSALRNKCIVAKKIQIEDFDKPPLRQLGGILKAQKLFGNKLDNILEELNNTVCV